MEDKEYSISISSPIEHVWDIMLGDETYPQWVKAFSENSEKHGEWKQGSQIDFIDTGKGGTRAVLEVVEKPKRLFANHIAILSKEGEVDTQSEAAQKWIGTTEEYILEENEGVTTVKVRMHAPIDFFPMFDSCWPKALELLKGLCEKQ